MAKTNIEGPAGYNGGKGPGGALKMPVKDYPASNKGLPKSPGKGGTVDGPAPKKYC